MLPPKKSGLVAIAAITALLSRSDGLPRPDQAMVAVAWCRTAAERVALCRQTYNTAKAMLDVALDDGEWNAALEQATTPDRLALPPAVIVDVDETVLDNSPYNARLVAANEVYTPDGWSAWVEERAARAIPGAVDFLVYAAGRGVTVFYVTNRSNAEEPATRDNLQRLGFPLADRDDLDVVLTKRERDEWSDSDKRLRRASVAQTHRVLMMFGDDLGDFLSGVKPKATVRNGDPVDVVRAQGVVLGEERLARTDEFVGWWGTRWFMLPNPMYGSWLETYEAVNAEPTR